MSHFLFRPHVSGPEDNITTPDILIDRVVLHSNGEDGFLPVQRLSSNVELQVFEGELKITPAYALVASGGGTLVGLAALVGPSDNPLRQADVVVARGAWRLRNLIDHFRSLELSAKDDGTLATVCLESQPGPADVITRDDNGELALPRGILLLCPVHAAALTVTAPASTTIWLEDAARDRELSQVVELLRVDQDRWAKRPLPRYTVGPVGDVIHYI